MRRQTAYLTLIVVTFLQGGSACPAAAPHPLVHPDPATDLVRVRVRITTTAGNAELTLGTGVVANQFTTVAAGPAGVRVNVRGNLLRVQRNVPGQSAEGVFQLLVAGVAKEQPVHWTLALAPPAATSIDVYNLNREDRPVLVDRFAAASAATAFNTPASGLREDGPLHVGSPVSRLVLAHFYPWYTIDTWLNPQMRDGPLQPYSTEDVRDMLRVLGQIRRAGIDAILVSWQGKDAGDGWNARRLRVLLTAAGTAGVKIAAFLETVAAVNPHPGSDSPTDAGVVFDWLADAVDRYGSDPCYLRIGGRPVVFVYAALRLRPDQWADVIERLHASGRHPLLVADSTDSAWLAPFAGQYSYANVTIPEADLSKVDRQHSLRVRTHHLLRAENGPRRIWAATVMPGFDDSALIDRSVHTIRDRASGAYYDTQWQAALESHPDWIVVTTWNEWWENTEIEPSRRYGDRYLQRTALWAARFHDTRGDDADQRPRAGRDRP